MPNKGFKSGKSSKTARVLNLLTDPESAETAAPAAAPSADSTRLADDRRTQARIRGALEQEFAGSSSSAPHVPEAPRSAPTVTPAIMPDFSEDVIEPVTQPQTPLQAHVEQLRAAGEEEPDEYVCFNVTQALVEDKADKYIKMFGLCNCNRCRIDVIALALSNLPAKYVVAKPHELIPRLSMYEQRYNAAVVTQVMGACRKVLDRPHHERLQQ
ncbi:MAG: late competence development ComFB family protein [Oscillospiraceae bacterium]|nr:late competence development ComFB family protein [Oscillospiraceae bacterium]